MGLRFRKSFKIAPGVKLNFGKKSAGLSLGNKYGGLTINSRNGVRRRLSIPGTGVSFVDKVGAKKKNSAGAAAPTAERSENMAGKTNGATPFYKKWWVIALAILAVIGGIQSCGEKEAAPVPTAAPTVMATAAPVSTPAPTPASTAEPQAAAVPAASEAYAASPQPASAGAYVASTDSDKYHVPGCRWAENINEENAVWFATEEDAMAAGYSRCGTCKP